MNLKDLDPKGFPHLEESWIGGNVDLDLFSIFPSSRSKNHGGIEGESSKGLFVWAAAFEKQL